MKHIYCTKDGWNYIWNGKCIDSNRDDDIWAGEWYDFKSEKQARKMFHKWRQEEQTQVIDCKTCKKRLLCLIQVDAAEGHC